MRYLPYLAALALAVYCVVDIAQHADPRPYRVPKWAWYLIVVLVPFLGAAAWFFMRFVDPFEDTPRSRNDGPIAPDDDPDYLRWLEQQERRRKREKGTS
ncbi:PLD nuclease N-terminal domain-containing protein [Demequina salsinemoris]|uniref:PLD nuclease N-terminal domain-containing protein n=1 Tax=Demequina salsinemoris TaxID=577470 RepID=UPI00078262C5|nr:PLD nuclease N-terminal domain-containing protein [Demequina salsinemoris]